MLKYFKFAWRFLWTYNRPKKYLGYGALPYFTTSSLGTVVKVEEGIEFKYYDLYVRIKTGWVKFESNEDQIKSSDLYKEHQKQITEELRKFKQDEGIL